MACAFLLRMVSDSAGPGLAPAESHLDYYTASAYAGPGMAGGMGADGWDGVPESADASPASFLVSIYLIGSIIQINAYTSWYLERSLRMRSVVEGVTEVAAAHPGSAFLLQGVDNGLFQTGFQDGVFRLIGTLRKSIWFREVKRASKRAPISEAWRRGPSPPSVPSDRE